MSAPANDQSVGAARTPPETREALRQVAALIRLGAAKRPQCYGHMFEWTATDGVRSCALGALYEGRYGYYCEGVSANAALTIMGELGLDREVLFSWPDGYTDPMESDYSSYWLCETIFRLNDGVKLSREEIADIVETLEVAP